MCTRHPRRDLGDVVEHMARAVALFALAQRSALSARLRADCPPDMDDEALSPLHVPCGPVSSIAEAVTVMTSISAALPSVDGLACFNRMYLIVTNTVLSEISSSTFYGDPAFMAHLDVVFVNLYLEAIDGFWAEPSVAPRCWSALLANRSDPHIAPMQFALAGMSAHINHDLPIAVV